MLAKAMGKILFFAAIWLLCSAQGLPVQVPANPAPTDHESLKLTLQTLAIGAAILIFLTREVLEFHRRRDARKRKLEAIKSYLARQCEFNNWFIRGMKDSLGMATAYAGADNVRIEVKFLRNGDTRLNVDKGTGQWSGRMIPSVRTAEFESKIIDIAELDNGLSTLLDAACEAAAEARHVKDSFISYVVAEDQEDFFHREGFFASFVEWANEELDHSYEQFAALYAACGRGDLKDKWRLR